MEIRDRVKELRRVSAKSLRPNPRNWRTHPREQQDALRGLLAEVGYADALLVRELPDGSLELVDGHLRAETTPEAIVPVLVLDLDESEAAKVLATLDPLAAMAETNSAKLAELLDEIETGSESLDVLLDQLSRESDRLAEQYTETGENDPAAEWVGMPECESEDQLPWRSVKVNFDSPESMAAFAKLVEQTITERTRSIWHPPQAIGRYADKQWTTNGS